MKNSQIASKTIVGILAVSFGIALMKSGTKEFVDVLDALTEKLLTAKDGK